nr:MAG TPA: hypothetical protein [Caudoviricetes sp.]
MLIYNNIFFEKMQQILDNQLKKPLSCCQQLKGSRVWYSSTSYQFRLYHALAFYAI